MTDPEDLAKIAHLDLLTSQIVDGFLSGRHRSKLKGGCAEFAAHRAYCPGDELRLLDWRVYGKSDRYYIKQFEEDTSLQAILLVDASGSMAFAHSTTSKFKYARAAALCLSRLLLRQGDAVGLHVAGVKPAFIPPRAKAPHFEILMAQLQSIRPRGRSSLAAAIGELAPRIKRRGLFLLFSDAFEDVSELARALKMLRTRRHEAAFFHVMAPEELSFDFGPEQSRFKSLEVDGQAMDLDPAAIRPGYLARVRAFLEELRRACGEAGCDYVPLRTDQPLGPMLAQYLRRREADRR